MALNVTQKHSHHIVMRLIFILACIPLLCSLIFQHTPSHQALAFKVPASPTASNASPQSINQTIHYPNAKFQHAISLLPISSDDVLASWYAGSAEHKPDTRIMLGDYDLNQHQWHDIHPVMSRQLFMAQQHRYIHTLGNPILVQQHHHIDLYFVTTIGGWSTSSLQVMSSKDNGHHWSKAHTLMTSPLLNISTLLKTGAVHYQDGSIGLPVYHELGDKNALLLHINHHTVLGMSRISWNHRTLQPLVLPLSDQTAIALMRDGGQQPRHVQVSMTQDAGQTWSQATNTSMPNPDAAISGLYLHHQILVVLNPTNQDRQQLVMAIYNPSTNRWKTINTIASDKDGNFSYPYLVTLMPHSYLLGYSANQHIKSQLFNNAWLTQQWT